MKKVRQWLLFHFTLYALIHIYLSSIHLTLGGGNINTMYILDKYRQFHGSGVNKVT